MGIIPALIVRQVGFGGSPKRKFIRMHTTDFFLAAQQMCYPEPLHRERADWGPANAPRRLWQLSLQETAD